jgi:hypothetical protein
MGHQQSLGWSFLSGGGRLDGTPDPLTRPVQANG